MCESINTCSCTRKQATTGQVRILVETHLKYCDAGEGNVVKGDDASKWIWAAGTANTKVSTVARAKVQRIWGALEVCVFVRVCVYVRSNKAASFKDMTELGSTNNTHQVNRICSGWTRLGHCLCRGLKLGGSMAAMWCVRLH